MKIALGCDHGGYELKEKVKKHLTEKGYEVTDFGCHSTESVNYPVYNNAIFKHYYVKLGKNWVK